MKVGIFKILLGFLILFPVNHVFADISPMVERHIFTPGNVVDQKEAGFPTSYVPVEKLQKELLFTGSMITPKGKYALISENQKSDNTKMKSIFKEGDQIKGMTLKEIGANYILIAGKEGDMRLNLYKGIKNRPSPVSGKTLPDTQTGLYSQTMTQTSQKTETTSPGQVQGLPKTEIKPTAPLGNPLQQGLPPGGQSQGSPPFGGSSQGLPPGGQSPGFTPGGQLPPGFTPGGQLPPGFTPGGPLPPGFTPGGQPQR